MSSVSAIGIEGRLPGERTSPRFSASLHSWFHHKISSANTEYEPGNDDKISATELDRHADYRVAGRYLRVLEDTSRKDTVTGFTSELG